MSKTKPCKAMFSNGMEYEWFVETQCLKCTRLRNGRCRVYRACIDARFDSTKFPYNDLLDYADGCAGKLCKHFTDKPIERKRKNKPIYGQYQLVEEVIV